MAVGVFGNQQVTGSGRKLADGKPAFGLIKLEDIVVVVLVIDTCAMAIFCPGIQAGCAKDNSFFYSLFEVGKSFCACETIFVSLDGKFDKWNHQHG